MREKNSAGGLRDNLNYNDSVQANTAFLDELKNKLPEFFTADRYDDNGELMESGFFDWKKFEQEFYANNIQKELSSGNQLDFIGKNYARQQAGERPTTVIVPDREHNDEPENVNSKNLFFTGDNLEVLRHLQTNYQNSVDFIYIDPPYNTGSDGFVYPDAFDYTDVQLQDMFGLDDDELKRLKSIQGKATHSAWLTFMYPRLYLAKKLLKNTGVIFVSIDDNEQANLKLLMDEIFGEGNFVANIVRKTTATAKSTEGIGITHDYIVAYGKGPENPIKGLRSETRILKDEYFEERGFYDYGRLGRASLRYNPNQDYPIEIDGFTFYPGGSKEAYEKRQAGEHGEKDWQWRWTKKMWEVGLANGFYANSNPESGVINVKSYEKARLSKTSDGYQVEIIEPKTTNINSMQFDNEFLNQRGSTEVANLIGQNVFSYPKPTTLPKFLMKLIQKSDALILDFFAGSSTTADAVMQLNAEDGGNRQFIMATLPEPTYTTNSDGTKLPTKGGEAAFKAGFRSIDEISRERIKRAAHKIKKENSLLAESQDFGFKHYRMVAPGVETLDKLEYSQDLQLDLFDDMLTPFSSQGLGVGGAATGFDTILSTWLVADGYRFDSDVSSVKFGNYEAPYVENTRVYIINNGWSAENTKALVNAIGTNQLVVQTIVAYGYEIDMESLRELEQALSVLENRVNLIVRY